MENKKDFREMVSDPREWEEGKKTGLCCQINKHTSQLGVTAGKEFKADSGLREFLLVGGRLTRGKHFCVSVCVGEFCCLFFLTQFCFGSVSSRLTGTTASGWSLMKHEEQLKVLF